MSAPSILAATARVRPGKETEFAAWKARHDTALGKFPGFVSSDMTPSLKPGTNEWAILLSFRTREDASAWRGSKERAEILALGAPLFEAGNLGEVIERNDDGGRSDTSVTEVIFSKIKPGKEDAYREWTSRIQAAQARYPGYRGTFCQPPENEKGMWTNIIRFDSAAQLEAWMEAPERRVLIEEASSFVEHEQFTRLATSFPGWVPVDPATGKGPPNWKTSMLVLLVLFPIVMLEMRFLSPVLAEAGFHLAPTTFISNALGIVIMTYAAMPLAIRAFRWWLFLKLESPSGTTLRGTMLLIFLFAVEVAALRYLLRW